MENISIVDMVEAKGLEWKPKSEDEILLFCPNAGSHKEGKDTNPSLHVNLGTRGAHCFVCGFKLSYAKLLNWLGGDDLDELTMRVMALRAKIAKIKEPAQCDIVSDDEVFFPVGDPWDEDGYRNISIDTYKELGAIRCNRGRYENRICLPIIVDGVLKGVDARALGDQQPKYLRNKNSTCRENWLFPYDNVKARVKAMPEDERYVIIGEGLFHGINGYDKGFPALCYFGVNNWSQNKLLMLVSLGVKEVIIFPDRDIAGLRAAQYIGTTMRDWFKITHADVNQYPEGADLGDLSAEEIHNCIASRHEPSMPYCMPDAKKASYKESCKYRRCPFNSCGICNNILWLGA